MKNILAFTIICVLASSAMAASLDCSLKVSKVVLNNEKRSTVEITKVDSFDPNQFTDANLSVWDEKGTSGLSADMTIFITKVKNGFKVSAGIETATGEQNNSSTRAVLTKDNRSFEISQSVGGEYGTSVSGTCKLVDKL